MFLHSTRSTQSKHLMGPRVYRLKSPYSNNNNRSAAPLRLLTTAALIAGCAIAAPTICTEYGRDLSDGIETHTLTYSIMQLVLHSISHSRYRRRNNYRRT